MNAILRLRPGLTISGLILACFVLTGCAETRFAAHVAKQASKLAQMSPEERRAHDARVRRASLRPYTVLGKRYVPSEQPDYDETGIASWYGEPFHGRATATGEIYDMNSVSAAHKTLPLPSMVEVTNLENGRVLTIRVNDRGPFVANRIIDLSRRAASLLGFQKQGVALVRVRVDSTAGEQFVMGSEEITTEERNKVMAAPQTPVRVTTLPAPGAGQQATPKPSQPAATNNTTSRTVPVANTRLFVQAGSFGKYANAERLRDRLSSLGPVRIFRATVRGKTYFRVQIGPLTDVAAADAMLRRVRRAGPDDARIIVD